jgi:hypothetical protein
MSSVSQLAPRNPPSSFTLQPGVLCGGCAVCRCQEWCNKCNTLQAVSVLLDAKMLVQQAHCVMICYAVTAFLRCNVGTERVAMHLNVAKVACAARRCGGKRVQMPYVAMGCIYASRFRMVASKYILLPWGTWQCRGKRAAISVLRHVFVLQLVFFVAR